MVNVNVNGIPVSVAEGTSILEAINKAGYKVPTLCFLKGVNEIGACRVCVVEVEGIKQLVSSCNNYVEEGMIIHTDTPRVREARRMNMELILSQHRLNCPTCARNANCKLRQVASSLAVKEYGTFKNSYEPDEWDLSLPIIRDNSKCIKCYRCVSECARVQTLNIWDMVGTGSRTSVGVSGNRLLSEADCAFCGQCVTHCPTNALHARNDTNTFFGDEGILNDPDKVTVVQVAPAVRAAWGEYFGLGPEVATEKRLAAALRRLGFDYVFDTNFSADLTIMEEGTEFLERLKAPDAYKWPMFTSCCPGWVRFLKSQYPDMVGQLSTAKSPQQMFGAVTKSYFAERIGVAPENIVCVSVMPCIAKKAELNIPNINDAAEGCKDVDYSLTTRGLCEMIKVDQIDITSLPEEEFDSPLGTGTGAAVIFGATGGVMEAALRTCYYVLAGENPDADETFKAVRASGSDNPWTEAEYNVAGHKVRAAVVSGLGNARRLIRALRSGQAAYDFVEVMACPGGCVGGGGQPIVNDKEMAAERARVLYDYDHGNILRFSHENPDVQELYRSFLGSPCSPKAHHLLHTDHFGWEMPPAPVYDEDVVVPGK